jgi:hypothetical protein
LAAKAVCAAHARFGSLSTELGVRAMSDLPLIAIELRTLRIGSFVPKAEMNWITRSPRRRGREASAAA